jgi:hypothetical protein
MQSFLVALLPIWRFFSSKREKENLAQLPPVDVK